MAAPTKLSDLFESAQAPSISYDGQTVYSMYEIKDIGKGATLKISFDTANSARPEGLRIKVRGAKLRIEGQDLDDIILWSDSAPPTIGAVVTGASKNGGTLRVWNCWRDPHGVEQAWIGNAGMLVSQQGETFTLRCSDGFDEATFDDLVAIVEVPR